MFFLIILVFQMSDFRYEIKTELKLRYLLSDLKHWLKTRVGPSQLTRIQQTDSGPPWEVRQVPPWEVWQILVDPVDDEDWKRSSTNWSFFNKWFGTGLGVILVLKRLDSAQLCVETPWLGPWDSQFQLDQFDRDSLVRVRTLYPVSYRVSSLVSRFVFTQQEPK